MEEESPYWVELQEEHKARTALGLWGCQRTRGERENVFPRECVGQGGGIGTYMRGCNVFIWPFGVPSTNTVHSHTRR